MGENLPANTGGTGSIPGPGRFHKPQSNEVGAPSLYGPRATTTEAQASRACAPQQEKSPKWEAYAQLESSPCSPQLENTCVQQGRPSAAKNKQIKIKGLKKKKEKRAKNSAKTVHRKGNRKAFKHM